jgi:glycosyltransferase involved in cell wall biosynthesis
MRIGMILDAPFPPDLRVEKEAISLLQDGHEVILFCLDYSDSAAQEVHKGIKIARYKSNVIEYKLSALAYTLPVYHWLMITKLKKFTSTFKPDVLHIHDMVIAEAALTVAEQLGLKSILDLHENRPEIMKEYLHLQKFPGKYIIDLKIWARKQVDLVKRADNIIVVTELAKNSLSKETGKRPDKIVVVPNTPSIDFLSHHIESSIIDRMQGTFNLLYIGDTSARRGIIDAIEAVNSLKDVIKNIRLWIIGKSSFDPYAKQVVQKLDIVKFVQFEGWQPERLFPSYITGSHICLSPLKRNVHHDTTFANKIFQYMSLGRPTLVSDCTAQAELITDENCGLVHEAGNIESLSNCIIKLFENEKLRESMGENAKAAVINKWNWEFTSLSLVELYKNL